MRELGYDTSFLYGGYGYFDNMNAFYTGNGFEVLDRNAISQVASRISGASPTRTYSISRSSIARSFTPAQAVLLDRDDDLEPQAVTFRRPRESRHP